MNVITSDNRSRLSDGLELGERNLGANPWANNYTLMVLSLWWVRNTSPGTVDFDTEVATTMTSLAREVR